MHSVSVKMTNNEFGLLEGLAKQGRKSKAEIIREALQTKAAYEEYKSRAIQEGIDSADNEPLTSHADALKEFAAFRRAHKEKHG